MVTAEGFDSYLEDYTTIYKLLHLKHTISLIETKELFSAITHVVSAGVSLSLLLAIYKTKKG